MYSTIEKEYSCLIFDVIQNDDKVCGQCLLANGTGLTEESVFQIIVFNYITANSNFTFRYPCKSGERYSFINESVVCDACLENQYGNGYECYWCPNGRYTNGSIKALPNCINCTTGRYQVGSSNRSCEICQMHTYSGLGSSYCSDCIPGRYTLSTESSECVECELGTYFGENHTCIPCPKNTFSNITGRTSPCDVCPIGRKSFPKSSSITDCKSCDQGQKYFIVDDDVICQDCPENTYGNGYECNVCPDGGFTNGT
jgi:hypothetical protein